MRMSMLQWLQCGLVASVIAFLLFAVLSRAGRKKDEPVPKWVPRTSLALLALVAVLVAAWCGVRSWYQKYGAFYDEAWREPGVEKYFSVTTEDTEALQAIYDSNPEGFEFDRYRVVLFRMGCEDCQKVLPTIQAFDQMPEYYVVFSRSPIGQAFIEHYDINYVPTVMYSGTEIQLRSSVSDDDESFDQEEFEDLLDELTDGMQSDPNNPGTVAGIQAQEDAKNNGSGGTDTSEP